LPRPFYNTPYDVPIESDEAGEICKQIAYRMHVVNGVRVRFCIGYQIRDLKTGRLYDIVRYDDAGGFVHRHSPGFPPGDQHIPFQLDSNGGFDAIDRDIEENAETYEYEAARTGYKVSEDADNDRD